jgi:hypothetical protein
VLDKVIVRRKQNNQKWALFFRNGDTVRNGLCSKEGESTQLLTDF